MDPLDEIIARINKKLDKNRKETIKIDHFSILPEEEELSDEDLVFVQEISCLKRQN